MTLRPALSAKRSMSGHPRICPAIRGNDGKPDGMIDGRQDGFCPSQARESWDTAVPFIDQKTTPLTDQNDRHRPSGVLKAVAPDPTCTGGTRAEEKDGERRVSGEMAEPLRPLPRVSSAP